MAQLKEAATKMVAQSHSNRRTGPSNKNLGPSADRKDNPASTVRSIAGTTIKGPDKGAGGM